MTLVRGCRHVFNKQESMTVLRIVLGAMKSSDSI
jgi:hypothetical protein